MGATRYPGRRRACLGLSWSPRWGSRARKACLCKGKARNPYTVLPQASAEKKSFSRAGRPRLICACLAIRRSSQRESQSFESTGVTSRVDTTRARGHGRFDLRNQTAVQFAHRGAEIFDDLLPTICVANGVLRVDDRICGNRNRKQSFEPQAPNAEHGETLVAQVPTSSCSSTVRSAAVRRLNERSGLAAAGVAHRFEHALECGLLRSSGYIWARVAICLGAGRRKKMRHRGPLDDLL